MRLHGNKELFRQAIQATSDQMGILPIYVEKDYWVTVVLYALFHAEISSEIVFKGGTALSKCFQMIERFSEDIDLVVLRKDGESNNKMKTKIKTIGKIVNDILPEIHIEGLTQKMGMNRKTAHQYEKVFGGDFGQVRDVIVLEATWLGDYEPFTTKPVSSLITQIMAKSGQEMMIEEYDLSPFNVRVLEPSRTICEKIMSLVRFSYTEDPISDLKKKIRHAHDLHQLLNDDDLSEFLESINFDKLLLKVAKDDVPSFKNNNDWLKHHPNDAVMFKNLENIWRELAPVYNNEFSKLVYGTLPNEKDVLKTLIKLRTRMAEIDWKIFE